MKKETIKPQHTVEKEIDKNLLNNIIQNNVSFENIAIRFNASVTTNKQNQNLKGNLVVKKDSIIWISITPIMGIEIFRIVITQDSVKFVNKLENTYYLGNHDFINNLLNTKLSYNLFQSLLVGNYYTENNAQLLDLNANSKQIKLVFKNEGNLNSGAASNNFLIHDIFINPQNYKVLEQKLAFDSSAENKLQIQYSNFQNLENLELFPHKLDLKIETQSITQININYTRVNLNRPFDFNFTIPRNFKPLQL